LRGYVKIFRKMIDSRVFQNEGLLKVWIWCLLKANHEERWVPMSTGRGATEVKVCPGQFIYGRKSAAKELKMKESTIRNRMKKLENMRNLDMQPDTHCTIVSIINWDIYQMQENKEDRQEDNQRTGKGQPKDTNKNVKNVKKRYGEGENVLLSSEEHGKLVDRIGNTLTQKYIERLSSYIASKGKQYKSHYHTILSWWRKDGEPSEANNGTGLDCPHCSQHLGVNEIRDGKCPVCGGEIKP